MYLTLGQLVVLSKFQVSYWFDNARRQLVVANAIGELGPEGTRQIAQNKLMSMQKQTAQVQRIEAPSQQISVEYDEVRHVYTKNLYSNLAPTEHFIR